MEGPKAPKDAVRKRPGFFLMRNKEIAGSIQPDGRGIQFLYQNDGRMVSSAKVVGNVTDEAILTLLKSAEGFRKLVYSIGVTVEAERSSTDTVDFVFKMYGKTDTYGGGTAIRVPVPADGREVEILLAEQQWSDTDKEPGQIRFEFPEAGQLATVSVKLYLQDGYEAPKELEETDVDFDSPIYRGMLEKSLMQMGNPARLKKALDKARRGEDITIAFIGGSITQGAGAIPINTRCYAYETFQGLCKLLGKGMDENIHYRKAGVGGTPSELGMIRYERDVLRLKGEEASLEELPDIVAVEFAVNDEGDETKGECYDSLVRKILSAKNKPAVILLFAVFVDGFNLQERLSPVGRAYDLPMVSVKDAVAEQFCQKPGAGRMVSKSQFFYDCYHPTNIGHRIMADCILHLLEKVDEQPVEEDTLQLEQIKPPLGGAFEKVKLLDRSSGSLTIAQIDCGDFCGTDEELQAVEMDEDLEPTKEFPFNWMYQGGKGDKADIRSANVGSANIRSGQIKPFSMDITCTSLLLVYKDSGSIHAGCAEVWADGEKVLVVDPHIIGWTHCNALICFRDKECGPHHVEIRMVDGDEDKEFTILGFGYVE